MLLNRIELKAALRELAASVEKQDQTLIFSNVFFETTETGVKLITCDGGAVTEIDFNVDNPIEFDVNFKALKAFVDGLKSDTVEFAIRDNKVVVVSGSSATLLDQHELIKQDFDEYEKVLKNSEEYKHEIVVSDTIFAAIDKFNPKFELNGMLVDFEKGMIVATDTRRLTYIEIEKMASDRKQIIIPKGSLKKGSTISNLHFDDRYAHYTLDGIKKKTSLINGRFPDFERIIPKDDPIIKIEINGLEAKEKLKKMGDCEMKFENDLLTVTSLDNGTSVFMPCAFPSAVPFIMNINTLYVLEAIMDNMIEININSSHLPIKITSVGSKVNTIVMPITLTESDLNKHDEIKKELLDNKSSFEYEVAAKKSTKRVNKDAIINALQKENDELKAKLAAYESDSSMVKSKVFKDIANKCKGAA